MLVLKRQIIECPPDFLRHLSLDADMRPYFHLHPRIIDVPISKKPWYGEVDLKRNRFNVVSKVKSAFDFRAYGVEIIGQKKVDDIDTFEIVFRLPWFAVLFVAFVFVVWRMVLENYNHTIGWSLFALLLIFYVLLIIRDFRKAKRDFFDYLEKIKSGSLGNVEWRVNKILSARA